MGKKKTVLVVDDISAGRRLLDAFLRDDFEIVQAANGPESLAAMTRCVPDMILLDLSLPGMDGVEVITRVRADPRTSRIPIIALTAHTLPEYEMRARGAGCNAYLVKPFDLENLRNVIDGLIREAGRADKADKEDVT